ncbi:hypothetical protein LXA43DRAFT_1099008 [Ganoderma leucocontextum]|nr:hypothetical protein LXA43DRAFT_1099008 [Ganoderma leucocontextum]
MSAIQLSAQELSNLYTNIYCGVAICVILVYDWLLCFGEEVRFIWNGRSGVTVSWLVYGLSRYALLIQNLLGLATIYPMSDLLYGKCMDTDGHQYTGHDRDSSLCRPACICTVEQEQMVGGDNHPVGATAIGDDHFNVGIRASQFAAELLVVGITWWYTYQSYRIRKGVDLGKTVSSVLFYTGSLYFLFLATLYMLDIIIDTASVPPAALDFLGFLQLFYDPITSILTCHFMLSLRKFDSTIASSTHSGPGSRVQEHMAFADVLQFAAQPSNTLPSFIASFAHPVHVDSALSEADSDEIVEDGSESWR